MSISRIAMLSYHTCPLASQEGKETGGMNVYVLELAKELTNKGITVDVFTRSQDLHVPHIVQVNPKFRVIHVVAGPEESLPKKELLQYIPEFVANYQKIIEQENIEYDLIHAHYYMSGIAGQEIQKLSKKKLPMIMTFHTLALMKNLVARTESEKEGSVRIQAEFELTKHADKIITPSESDRSYLQYLYQVPESKVSIIPPGVDTKLFRPIDKSLAKKKIDADEDHKIVLFAGRIEPLKGIDVLIFAMKILKERNPNLKVCLWIVGGDISQKTELWSNELQKLEELRQVLNIPGVVKFVGQKPQDELVYYYNAAETVVMPSHYESFGMSAAEAMACGVPIITTDVAGISSLIDEKHISLISSANNPLMLASKIEDLLSDEQRHTQISEDVLSHVQDLAWPVVADQVIKTYDEVIKV
jgi:D-inositol-3-phosphate glycosyltransferase